MQELWEGTNAGFLWHAIPFSDMQLLILAFSDTSFRKAYKETAAVIRRHPEDTCTGIDQGDYLLFHWLSSDGVDTSKMSIDDAWEANLGYRTSSAINRCGVVGLENIERRILEFLEMRFPTMKEHGLERPDFQFKVSFGMIRTKTATHQDLHCDNRPSGNLAEEIFNNAYAKEMKKSRGKQKGGRKAASRTAMAEEVATTVATATLFANS